MITALFILLATSKPLQHAQTLQVIDQQIQHIAMLEQAITQHNAQIRRQAINGDLRQRMLQQHVLQWLRQQHHDALEDTLHTLQPQSQNLGSPLAPPPLPQINTAQSNRSIIDRKGQLPWPITGYAFDFTDQAPQLLGSSSHNEGLLIAPHTTQAVYPVHTGRVAFTQNLGTLGGMVLLQHDHQIYSLYSGLRHIQVHTEQSVSEHTPLGIIEPQHTLYFELRQHTRPINVQRWLVPKPTL